MQLEVGKIFEGKVTGITNFGVFVELPDGSVGMVHISEVAPVFVKEIRDHVKEGQDVKVKVLEIGQSGKISLSIKKAMDNNKNERKPYKRQTSPGNVEWNNPNKNNGATSFEDMMSKFKKTSDEKMSDLKRATESKRGGFSRRGGSRSI